MASSAASPTITKHDLETRLIEKCWKEPEFRKEVLADPKGTFERHFGRPLPADLKIVIHEDTPNAINLALPPAPTSVAELSDEELEKVAGGTEFTIALTIALTVVASVATAATVGVGISAGVQQGKPGW